MLHREFAYFATGNAVFEDRIPVLVLLPKSQLNWVYLSFFGALEYMTEPATWITAGETDVDEAVKIFKTIYDEARAVLFYIGMVSDFSAALPDSSGWLQCDGTAYRETDFPDLFDAIGAVYNTGGEPSGFFRVPDTLGRVRATINGGDTRLPSWADSAGGTGGEADHVLSEGEMPSHSHTDVGHTHVEGNAAPTIGAAVVGVPIPSAIPSVGVTGTGNASLSSTGSDDPHNNVQPTMTFFTYILANF